MPSIIYRKGMPREEKVGESWEQVASHAKQVVKAKKLEGWKKFQNCCTKTIKTKMNSLIMHMEDQRDREVEGDILHVSGHGAASSALRDLLASVLDSIQAAKSVQDHTDISAL